MSNTLEDVVVPLTREEAIVLFEFLYRHDESGTQQLFEEQSGQRVFWDLIAVLEKQFFIELTNPIIRNLQLRPGGRQVRDKR